jgi:hypothetical protein
MRWLSLSALTQLLDVWLNTGQLQSKIGIGFILFYLFLFVYLNSPADHLAHRRGAPVVRGPQVESCTKTITTPIKMIPWF